MNGMMRLFTLLLIAAVLLPACKHKQYLKGYYSYEQYQKEAKWKRFVDDRYHPKEAVLDSIAALGIQDSLRMEIYLGSYCHDSKREVPRFYRFREHMPVNQIEIICLDTTKIDEKGMAKAAGVQKIPTFIIYDGERELGRVVENPKGRLEARLYEILKYGQE